MAKPKVSSTRKKASRARRSGPLSKRERRAAPSTRWRRLRTTAVSRRGRVVGARAEQGDHRELERARVDEQRGGQGQRHPEDIRSPRRRKGCRTPRRPPRRAGRGRRRSGRWGRRARRARSDRRRAPAGAADRLRRQAEHLGQHLVGVLAGERRRRGHRLGGGQADRTARAPGSGRASRDRWSRWRRARSCAGRPAPPACPGSRRTARPPCRASRAPPAWSARPSRPARCR